ncbi:MAG: DUF3025 domain-containing protein [Azonexus sp.]|nr:DUF3025 domain-containing protein [Azonexus sp.]
MSNAADPHSRWDAPLFAPLRQWLEQLPTAPASAGLYDLLVRHPLPAPNGGRLRFAPPVADGLAYERRVWAEGVVETRPDNWHDFFNALVWLSFPRAKRAINACHIAAARPDSATRGPLRDALTHFDECGLIVLSTQADLLDLLRRHRWRELFVDRRESVGAAMRFIVFGHATYEALLRPFRGLTAKAVLYEVSEDWLRLPPTALNALVDARLADDLAADRHAGQPWQPVPLLGIPGVTPESDNPAYYDDASHFRPLRRGA